MEAWCMYDVVIEFDSNQLTFSGLAMHENDEKRTGSLMALSRETLAALDSDFREAHRMLFGCTPEEFHGVEPERVHPDCAAEGWDADGRPVESP